MERTGVVITALLLVVVVLVGIILYAFVVKPKISGYTVNAQSEGFEFAIVSIMQRAAQCQTVPLTFENTTINLIAVECLQQAQDQQTGQAIEQAPAQ